MPPHASSVSQARALLREALGDAAESLVECAQLAVSEVVTNALVHAGTEVHVQVRLDGAGLRVEVTDGSPHLPTARDYSPSSGTGRGLHMVMSSVDDWGCYRCTGGKVVWFEIRTSPHPAPGFSLGVPQPENDTDAAARVVAEAENVVAVELLNLPLLMHLAWQEHAAALLREFLLVALDDDEQAAFERHAAASEAMSLLHEQVPQPPLLEDPDAIMTAAMEPGVTAGRLVVRVPRAVVADFHTLDLMLDEASALASTGALLVPPTQPEMAAMRRWVCAEVRQQDRASSTPTPWSSTLGQDTGPEPHDWEPAIVVGSQQALLAMDEAGTIVAVSGSTAELLGYASPADLRGQRLLRIVPPRYHQAHVAGTTLHMINGRSPLLGRRVTVPVVRADGEEISLDLEVQPRQLVEGRHVFIAEFFGS